MDQGKQDGQVVLESESISTNPKVIVYEDFEMPQLGRKRRITVLLPYDYYTSSDQYPVLYLHDAQNLYAGGSKYGNWEVDEHLGSMAKSGMHKIILVLIDHGEEERFSEFNPFKVNRYGRAKGRKYLRFIVHNLKPHIDSEFRTLPDRNNTGIGGSSMGGLISMWAGIKWTDVFGKLLIFSPSFWISPMINFRAMLFKPAGHTDIFFYGGEKESSKMVPHIHRVRSILESRARHESAVHTMMSVNPHGEHDETCWSEMFPQAVEWLFFRDKK